MKRIVLFFSLAVSFFVLCLTSWGQTPVSIETVGAYKDDSSPTRTVVRDFTAKLYTAGVLIEWRTGYEANNLGFHLYREQNGARTRITPSILAGAAFTSNAVLIAGHTYSWFDPEGAIDAVYYLEDIEINGTHNLSQPNVVVSGADDQAETSVNQKRRAILLSEVGAASEERGRAAQHGQPASLNSLSAKVTGLRPAAPLGVNNQSPYGDNRSLLIPSPQQLTQRIIAAQRAVKISVKSNGWYRIAQKDLLAAGLDPEVYPNFLQLYADGQEVPIVISNASKGIFGTNDYIEFYGLGLDTPTADTRIYYLVAGTRQGRRIATASKSPQKHIIHILTKDGTLNFESPAPDAGANNTVERNDDKSGARANSRVKNSRTPKLTPYKYTIANTPLSFPYIIERKDRTIFFGSLLIEGDDFFGPVVSSDPTTQNLTVINLDPNGQASLQIALRGATNVTHIVKIALNGTDVGTMTFNNREEGLKTFPVPVSLIHEGNNNVTYTAVGGQANGQTDASLIDFIRLTYAHTYRAENNALAFSLDAGQSVKVLGFNSPTVRVVDISNPFEPLELTPRIEAEGGNYAATLDAPSGGRRTLYAFLDGASQTPTAVTAHQPSTLARPDQGADFVIITHSSLRSAVEPLRQLRVAQGLKVMVIEIEDIFAEFSYGAHDPQAMTEFFRYAMASWQTPPRFALLVGDATYDPRNYLGFGRFDLVPTKLILTTYSKTSSDEALAEFKGDGIAALAIGRLPARTPAEAQRLIAKIINYSPSAMPSKVMFVADKTDKDFGFISENDSLRQYLPADITVIAVNRDDASDQVIHSRIIDGINSGPFIVNYAGHGAVEFWTEGAVLSGTDALALTNGTRLPFFSMMTCLSGYFQYPDNHDSLAESLLKAENGGAIAVWASSGSTVPSDQTIMNNELYRQIFGGNPATLGEMVRQAKTATQDLDVRRTWILFGDPTIYIRH